MIPLFLSLLCSICIFMYNNSDERIQLSLIGFIVCLVFCNLVIGTLISTNKFTRTLILNKNSIALSESKDSVIFFTTDNFGNKCISNIFSFKVIDFDTIISYKKDIKVQIPIIKKKDIKIYSNIYLTFPKLWINKLNWDKYYKDPNRKIRIYCHPLTL